MFGWNIALCRATLLIQLNLNTLLTTVRHHMHRNLYFNLHISAAYSNGFLHSTSQKIDIIFQKCQQLYIDLYKNLFPRQHTVCPMVYHRAGKDPDMVFEPTCAFCTVGSYAPPSVCLCGLDQKLDWIMIQTG